MRLVTETKEIDGYNTMPLVGLVEDLSALLKQWPDAVCEIRGQADDRGDYDVGAIVVRWERPQTEQEAQVEREQRVWGAKRRELDRLESDAAAFARAGVPFPQQAKLDEMREFFRDHF